MRSLALAFTLLLMSSGFAQQEQAPAPEWRFRFADYKVGSIYHGKPAPAKIVTKWDRQFRTRIREGARKGPNFAGHYTVADWGCGSGCVSFVIVDAKTGRVSWSRPFSSFAIPFQGTQSGRDYVGLDYHLDSRLLIADGCPDEDDSEKSCGTYYYVLDEGKFRLLAFDPVAIKRD